MAVFDSIALEYELSHANNPHQVRAAEDLASQLSRNSSVLDLGCGTGSPVVDILSSKGHQVLGLDISEEMLDIARKKYYPGAFFMNVDMTAFNGVSQQFDAVVAHFSLLMLPRNRISIELGRIRAFLKPGGLLSLAMVDFDGDSVPVDFMGVTFPASGYNLQGLTSLLIEHQFEVLSAQSVVHEPPGGPAETQLFVAAREAGSR